MHRSLILGGPGTGKTTRLLSIVDSELAVIPSYQIAFVSFTNAAVDEAANRAIQKFGIPRSRFPFFRTIHSLCLRQLAIPSNGVMRRSDLQAIGDSVGVPISGRVGDDGLDESMKAGDRMLFLQDFARSTKTSLRDAWERFGDSWDIVWEELSRFVKVLIKYKEINHLIDFTDMLELFVARGEPVPVKAAVIDEAQDLTHLQWDAVDLAFSACDRQYIAGDDDQAIYEWSGADVRRFLHMDEDEREILPKSYRLPKSIADHASKLSSRISDRYEKEWVAKGPGGSVQYLDSIEDVDIRMGDGTWLLLSRNVCFFPHLQDEAYWQGMPFILRKDVYSVDPEDIRIIKAYEHIRKGGKIKGDEARDIFRQFSAAKLKFEDERLYGLADLFRSDPGIWHMAMSRMPSRKRAYYHKILAQGEKISSPRIRINTIHGVKGSEADNVVLLTDVTKAVSDNFDENPDSEIRVFYVGATRAKKTLFIIRPNGMIGFPLL